MCIHLGKKTTTVAEVTQQFVEHSYNTRHVLRNICKTTGLKRIMFNKIVNINDINTKFATIARYTCIIICTKFCKNRTTFAEVRPTLKNRMDLSSWTRAWLPPVLNFRCLRFLYVDYNN